MDSLGVILQARASSTRLPRKMLLPFYNEKTILDILIENIRNNFNGKIIVATSLNESDEKIVDIAKKNNVAYFRGDEENVLKRFVDASNEFGLKFIVRICADNPFISSGYFINLIHEFEKAPIDYLSYCLKDQTPVIKTPLGFFTEIVSKKALEKTISLANEKIYLEHVTSFIYANRDLFEVKLIPLPDFFDDKKYVRLTVDTRNDFENAQKIYTFLKENNKEVTPENCFEIINANTEMKKTMIAENELNKK